MDAQVNFSVSADVAVRAGLANERYRTADGRFVMTDKDLQRVRLTPEEIVHGLDAIMLTKQEAEHLIAENGLKMGFEEDTAEEEPVVEQPVEVEEAEAESEGGDGEESEETNDAESDGDVENEEEEKS